MKMNANECEFGLNMKIQMTLSTDSAYYGFSFTQITSFYRKVKKHVNNTLSYIPCMKTMNIPMKLLSIHYTFTPQLCKCSKRCC